MHPNVKSSKPGPTNPSTDSFQYHKQHDTQSDLAEVDWVWLVRLPICRLLILVALSLLLLFSVLKTPSPNALAPMQGHSYLHVPSIEAEEAVVSSASMVQSSN